MTDNSTFSKLLELLDNATETVREYSGGYSGSFLSAEDFHKELKLAVDRLKSNDMTVLDKIQTWFLPTSAWDDFVGMDGIHLGNSISDLTAKIINKSKVL